MSQQIGLSLQAFPRSPVRPVTLAASSGGKSTENNDGRASNYPGSSGAGRASRPQRQVPGNNAGQLSRRPATTATTGHLRKVPPGAQRAPIAPEPASGEPAGRVRPAFIWCGKVPHQVHCPRLTSPDDVNLAGICDDNPNLYAEKPQGPTLHRACLPAHLLRNIAPSLKYASSAGQVCFCNICIAAVWTQVVPLPVPCVN
jgi:hypothetical protein